MKSSRHAAITSKGALLRALLDRLPLTTLNVINRNGKIRTYCIPAVSSEALATFGNVNVWGISFLSILRRYPGARISDCVGLNIIIRRHISRVTEGEALKVEYEVDFRRERDRCAATSCSTTQVVEPS